MNLGDLRITLHAALASTLTELNVYRTQRGTMALPCLVIGTPTSGSEQQTFDDHRKPVFPLRLFFGTADPESSIDAIDRYLSTDTVESIERALNAMDPDDYGISVKVVEYGEVDPARMQGIDALAAEILVEVWSG